MKPGRKPANAALICQLNYGAGSSGWIELWADSANPTAAGAAQGVCQQAANAHVPVRWGAGPGPAQSRPPLAGLPAAAG